MHLDKKVGNLKKLQWYDRPSIAYMSGHSANVVYNDVIGVFGGITRGNKFKNYLYFFDAQTENWKLGKLIGAIPPRRAGHGSYVLEQKLYIYGGVGESGYLQDLYSISLCKHMIKILILKQQMIGYTMWLPKLKYKGQHQVRVNIN